MHGLVLCTLYMKGGCIMSDFDTFKAIQKKMKAYQTVLSIASWDSNTEAPKDCFPYRSEMLSIISGEHFSLTTSPEYKQAINALLGKSDELNANQIREVEKAKKGLDKIDKIPKGEYIEYNKMRTMAQRVWEEAKENDDFELFKPYLEKIVDYQKKMVAYRSDTDTPYNVLLDDFEEGMTMEKYDEFFDTIKTELVPFVKEILEAKEKENDAFITRSYPKAKQKEFVEYLLDVFDYNLDRGGLKESVHPFTWNTHSKDVRLTVRYLENFVFSSIFAGIHELGHALYEQQIDEVFDMSNLGNGASMGIHESQSRFYENVIGRSHEFWTVHFTKLKSIFPDQLKDVNVEDFYRGINRVEESFIRVEADELTYPLHILIRYEIERSIFNEGTPVDELPDMWNQKMKQYLNIEVDKPSNGILQDVHWSGGMFGYFPTYALGSAYAAQIYYTIKDAIDFESLIEKDKIHKINEWLKDNIHCFGSSLTPEQILKKVTNEPFNPKYYIRYLKEKYSDLYL